MKKFVLTATAVLLLTTGIAAADDYGYGDFTPSYETAADAYASGSNLGINEIIEGYGEIHTEAMTMNQTDAWVIESLLGDGTPGNEVASYEVGTFASAWETYESGVHAQSDRLTIVSGISEQSSRVKSIINRAQSGM
ncbi:MAG: hypothetical protein ACI9H6_000098 [Patiriisocius sp.]|jgi:hypothetical protein